MAATSTKAGPSALHQFTHGTPFDTHRDLASPSYNQHASSSSSATSGFRRQGAWPAPNGGTDDDFGRFASSGPWSNTGASAFGGASSSWRGADSGAAAASSGARNGLQDGAEVMALLGSSTVADQIHDNWEAELLAEQASTRSQQLAKLPVDPLATSSSRDKGKGRDFVSTPGDVSPVSSELLSSLSSMDLSNKTYLKTLLAAPSGEVFRDYFSQGTYTDDVYGLPEEVRKVLEKASSGEGTQEEGRAKAVRRLGMVMRHLWSEGSTTTTTEATNQVQQVNKDNAISEQQARLNAVENSYASTLSHLGRQRQVPSTFQQQQRPLQHQQPSFPVYQTSPPPVDTTTSTSTSSPSHHETSYRTDFSAELVREDSPKSHERQEEESHMAPFAHFLSGRVEELYRTGGRPSPSPTRELAGFGWMEEAFVEGRSH